MSVNGSLGQSIKAMRKMKNMTQEELSDKTGLSRSTISGIETGRQIVTQENLLQISKALGYGVFITFRQIKGKNVFTSTENGVDWTSKSVISSGEPLAMTSS